MTLFLILSVTHFDELAICLYEFICFSDFFLLVFLGLFFLISFFLSLEWDVRVGAHVRIIDLFLLANELI